KRADAPTPICHGFSALTAIRLAFCPRPLGRLAHARASLHGSARPPLQQCRTQARRILDWRLARPAHANERERRPPSIALSCGCRHQCRELIGRPFGVDTRSNGPRWTEPSPNIEQSSRAGRFARARDDELVKRTPLEEGGIEPPRHLRCTPS